MGVIVLALIGCAWIRPDERQQALIYQLDREVIALQLRNEQLRDQVERCDEAPQGSALYTELLQVFSGSEVSVAREGEQTVVTIPGSLLFSSGSTTIRSEAIMVIDLLSVALRLHAGAKVRVIGHTDDRPLAGALRRRYGTNWELSVFRAASLMRAMVEDFGVEEERFTIAGRGASQPIATNDTPEGRERNRRLVVIIGPMTAGM